MGDKSSHRQDSKSSLADRIEQAEQSARGQANRPRAGQVPAEGLALAGRVAIELVAGLVVGGFIGWLLDRWLDTAPAFMLGLFFLGAAGGMMNVWRLVSGRNMKAGYFEERRADNPPPDKDRSR